MNYLDDLMKIEYIKEDKRKYFKNKKLKVENKKKLEKWKKALL